MQNSCFQCLLATEASAWREAGCLYEAAWWRRTESGGCPPGDDDDNDNDVDNDDDNDVDVCQPRAAAEAGYSWGEVAEAGAHCRVSPHPPGHEEVHVTGQDAGHRLGPGHAH